MYPALAMAEGHAYPRVPTFGVPCPTTILTIGFLLAADQLPRGLAAVPLVWTAIGGSAAFMLGVRADLMLIVSGVALLAGLIASRIDGRPNVRLKPDATEIS